MKDFTDDLVMIHEKLLRTDDKNVIYFLFNSFSSYYPQSDLSSLSQNQIFKELLTCDAPPLLQSDILRGKRVVYW